MWYNISHGYDLNPTENLRSEYKWTCANVGENKWPRNALHERVIQDPFTNVVMYYNNILYLCNNYTLSKKKMYNTIWYKWLDMLLLSIHFH